MMSGSSTRHAVYFLVIKSDEEGELFSQEKEGEGSDPTPAGQDPKRACAVGARISSSSSAGVLSPPSAAAALTALLQSSPLPPPPRPR